MLIFYIFCLFSFSFSIQKCTFSNLTTCLNVSVPPALFNWNCWMSETSLTSIPLSTVTPCRRPHSMLPIRATDVRLRVLRSCWLPAVLALLLLLLSCSFSSAHSTTVEHELHIVHNVDNRSKSLCSDGCFSCFLFWDFEEAQGDSVG